MEMIEKANASIRLIIDTTLRLCVVMETGVAPRAADHVACNTRHDSGASGESHPALARQPVTSQKLRYEFRARLWRVASLGGLVESRRDNSKHKCRAIAFENSPLFLMCDYSSLVRYGHDFRNIFKIQVVFISLSTNPMFDCTEYLSNLDRSFYLPDVIDLAAAQHAVATMVVHQSWTRDRNISSHFFATGK